MSATVPLAFERLPEPEMRRRAEAFLARARTRRSVRDFAPDPVPRALIEAAVAAAHTAPSGANLQPWHFVAVSDPDLKRRIREAAEAEERAFYAGRATETWLEELAPLGTTWEKPFLETAPWLVVVFRELWRPDPEGGRRPDYYTAESVGLACGLFLAALHDMGLATLTHTPAPMGFLSRLLERPEQEKPFILFPVGYPAPGARVPAIGRKPLSQVLTWR